MKVLMCELCNSTDLIKEDGVFVCKSCGAKYSVEEAKSIMIDGTGEIARTVKIDISSELMNLYEIARRAKDSNNSENALKYYDMILIKDPGSWEANFYIIYFRAMLCKIAEIQKAAISVSNCIVPTFNLIKSNVIVEEQENVIREIYSRISLIAEMLYNGAKNHYNNIDIQIRQKYTQEYINNVTSCTDIMYTFGDRLTEVFGEIYGITAAEAWKKGVSMHNGYIISLLNKQNNKDIILQYVERIKKYNASYQAPLINTSAGGCYIATAVYGSYDCSEVWVLRRFRDNTLARTWYGKTFIETYYTTSPTFVKWFGKTKWFSRIWRSFLDKLVNKLRNNGIEDTPYQDH